MSFGLCILKKPSIYFKKYTELLFSHCIGSLPNPAHSEQFFNTSWCLSAQPCSDPFWHGWSGVRSNAIGWVGILKTVPLPFQQWVLGTQFTYRFCWTFQTASVLYKGHNTGSSRWEGRTWQMWSPRPQSISMSSPVSKTSGPTLQALSRDFIA